MFKEDLLDNIHRLYRKDPYIRNIFNSAGLDLDNLKDNLQDMLDQYDFTKMTWGIPMMEKILGFKTNSNSSIDDKRNQLETRWKMGGKSDASLLKSIIGEWEGTRSDIYFKDGIIDIEILKESNSTINMATINSLIKDSIPCHLPYTTTLGYLSFIIIKLLFDRWFSDVLSRCGTFTSYEDGSKESITPLITGWSFKDFINSFKYEYFSDEFMRASASTFAEEKGYSISKIITKYFSRYFSDNFMKASENTFTYGQGISYKETISENLSTYFSEKFKKCSENLYSEGGKLIYDS